ncbi:putative Concanavalin A-like lectin protein kinase family protein [Hibiscus syriacus]|uniref:Concanavalin A-like lectin protein kinase family protein n=1 Tax=Hibiscus syriacus TaxID=106335 RepID=A0A6A3B8H5_HIBSY|nr:protein NODULATION SIGNALING PATHWAY 2-like [Hibiscus syriacus]KAE8711645.1 putative Concanavalin A-like lectin protein kinase family protein [Hibiscus syriacus]
MMQSENFTPLWPFNDGLMDSKDFGLNMDVRFDGCSSFATREESCFSTMLSDVIFPYPTYGYDDQLQVTVPWGEFSVPLVELDSMLTDDGVGEESFLLSQSQPCSSQRQDVWSPCRSSEASVHTTTARSMPGLGEAMMGIENQLTLFHLLTAYGEAKEKNQTELAEVILRCVSEKGNPVGETLERIAFNLSSQDVQNQRVYLMQESSKNFEVAFQTFYQIFPYGRFAHFAANSAILEAIPNDIDVLHIVDFDIGVGIQWPLLIEAMSMQHKTLRLTSIRWGEEHFGQSPWRFQDTKVQLCNLARTFGLKFEIEETRIEDLANELEGTKKRGGSQKWLAFNCMVGLSHMGKSKNRKLVNKFLDIAKQVLATNRGIITLGDGDACEKLEDSSGFGAFFIGQLMHNRAIIESMEFDIAKHLVQARTAMECLFVGPNINAEAWFQKWENMNETCHFVDFEAGTTLEGLKVSIERVMEAKEMVREKDNSYEVRIGGNSGHELALEWRGNRLVEVSCWRN